MKTALRAIFSTLAIAALGVLCLVLVVWVYSTFIAPGKDISAYQSFAQSVGPWVSVTAGPLITFLVIRLATQSLDNAAAKRTAVTAMVLYLALDVSILVPSKPEFVVWILAMTSYGLRCIAALVATTRPR